MSDRSESTKTVPELGCDALFADLLATWKRRAKTAEQLANDAARSGDWTTRNRCQTKAGVIRSMIVELEREISQANA